MIITLFLASLIAQYSAHAALGGTEASVVSDSLAFHGAVREAAQRDGYTIHEIAAPNGPPNTRIVEYTLPDGTVFAVVWQGISQPDLSVLLGSYFNEYKSAALPSKSRLQRGRGLRSIRTEHIVVEKFGHMRDLRGIAYLPEQLPEGFRLEALQ